MAARTLIARKKRRFVRTTVADPTKQPAPNVLNREFTADAPNRKWVSDITEIPTDEGALYLAVTQVALLGAVRNGVYSPRGQRSTASFYMIQGARGHQGSQYTANGFRGQLRDR